MNNYERIKKMTVDEMAETLSETATNCEFCRIKSLCNVDITCSEAYKQWLVTESE